MAATRTEEGSQGRLRLKQTEINEKDNYDRDPDDDAAVGRSMDVCLWADALPVGESGQVRIELDIVPDLVDGPGGFGIGCS